MWQLGHITENAEAPTRQRCSGPDAFSLSYLMSQNQRDFGQKVLTCFFKLNPKALLDEFLVEVLRDHVGVSVTLC